MLTRRRSGGAIGAKRPALEAAPLIDGKRQRASAYAQYILNSVAVAGVSSATKSPKFQPLPNLQKKVDVVPIVDGVVPRGASILIIQQPWIGLLLDGYKTLEIRGQKCKKAHGEKVYLALSGGGGTILGSMTFVASHGPLTRAEYAGRSDEHCVAGAQLPYGASTYAWEFKAPRRFRLAVPYVHRHGCVVWATKE